MLESTTCFTFIPYRHRHQIEGTDSFDCLLRSGVAVGLSVVTHPAKKYGRLNAPRRVDFGDKLALSTRTGASPRSIAAIDRYRSGSRTREVIGPIAAGRRSPFGRRRHL